MWKCIILAAGRRHRKRAHPRTLTISCSDVSPHGFSSFAPRRAIFNHGADDFLKSKDWREPDRLLHALQARHAARHVVEGLAIRLLIGDVFDLTLRAGEFDHLARQ